MLWIARTCFVAGILKGLRVNFAQYIDHDQL